MYMPQPGPYSGYASVSDQDVQEKKPRSSRSRVILVIIVGVVLVLGAVAAAVTVASLAGNSTSEAPQKTVCEYMLFSVICIIE